MGNLPLVRIKNSKPVSCRDLMRHALRKQLGKETQAKKYSTAKLMYFQSLYTFPPKPRRESSAGNKVNRAVVR